MNLILYFIRRAKLACSKIQKKNFRNFRKMISQSVFDNKISIFLKRPTYCSFIL